MSVVKVLCTALLTGLSLFASAASLTFDLQIKRGAPVDHNPEIKKIVFVKFCKMKSPEKADAEQLSFAERRLWSAGTAVRRNVTRLQF